MTQTSESRLVCRARSRSGSAMISVPEFVAARSVLCLVLLALVVVLVAEGIQTGPLDLALVGALAAFAGWSLLSVLWSPGPDEPAFAAERVLVYVAGAAVAVVGLRRERVAWLLGG